MASISTGSCGSCLHCGGGIPFDKTYFLCLYCGVSLCLTCQPRHPRSHLNGLRRLTDTKLPQDASTRPGKVCKNCKEECYVRFECASCDIVICSPCFGSYYESLLGHEHKGYTFYQVPHLHLLWQYETVCVSCTLGASMDHCTICNEGNGPLRCRRPFELIGARHHGRREVV